MTVVTGELLARIANAMAHCLTAQKSFRLSGTEIAGGFVWDAPLDDDGEPWDIGEWFHECLELPDGYEYSLEIAGDTLVITANSDEWSREEAA